MPADFSGNFSADTAQVACENSFGGFFCSADIDYVRKNLKSNLPDDITFANRNLEFGELMRSLDVGQALVSNTESERSIIVDIRPRVSVHGGF